ncbi:MAG TPA: DUF2188 domain-containing protein [Atribacterota bacterium]|nr:DUF2188 domain-containing protein [Atribacterota bacterium]HOR43124.1 DUF2188 domain-containing protein [Atribacterota bacterium]HPK41672.1 DUF2188 domain-containing protein [Candidatus Cloacimonadota bacterium]
MSKGRDRSVYRKDGQWHNKRNDAKKSSSVHATQRDAGDAAKRMLTNQGGGELTIMRRKDGKIRSKDTIRPGNDPYPPKDTEH